MLTGELRSQIDAIWNSFWTGGISNPLEVMEQITYLLFLRRLDDLHTLEENKSVRLGTPMARPWRAASTRRALTPGAAPLKTCSGRASKTLPRPRCTPWWKRTCSRFCAPAWAALAATAPPTRSA